MNYRGLDIPTTSFGAVTSDDLFCEKEQALFDFYEQNAGRYKTALDIGANIGVHTILMARAGWTVNAIEPDPVHYNFCIDNVSRNLGGLRTVTVALAAVSDRDGSAKFIRVKGNTTGSHLAGDKTPYGELEEFEVQTIHCGRLFPRFDFAKIDCEGHEARLMAKVTKSMKIDFMLEVGSPANARAIYDKMRMLKRRMWSQKLGWKEVKFLLDVPQHHSEGGLFIGEEAPF